MSLSIFLTLMTICCGYAAVRGGAPERLAAGLQVMAFAMSFVVHRWANAAGYSSAEGGMAAIDVALLVALIVIAHRSTRFWPLWIAAWQFVTVIAHAAKLLDAQMLATGYAIQTQLWAYPMLAVTATGAWRHHARVLSGDPDLSWKWQYNSAW